MYSTWYMCLMLIFMQKNKNAALLVILSLLVKFFQEDDKSHFRNSLFKVGWLHYRDNDKKSFFVPYLQEYLSQTIRVWLMLSYIRENPFIFRDSQQKDKISWFMT